MFENHRSCFHQSFPKKIVKSKDSMNFFEAIFELMEFSFKLLKKGIKGGFS